MSTLELNKEVMNRSLSQLQHKRQQISDCLGGVTSGLVAIVGPCALTDDAQTIALESKKLAQVEGENKGLVVSHRLPPWKPRTNPNDWHGEETTNPLGAMRTLRHVAEAHGHLSLEIGKDAHISRYAWLSAFYWTGARNISNKSLILDAVVFDRKIPLGIKNGLNGDITEAIRLCTEAKKESGRNRAAIVPIFRGGENAQNPDEWQAQFKRAHNVTDGKFVVDVAHGGEMAHDRGGKFSKSVVGQIACMEHVISLASDGFKPAGVMLEASDAGSPTDPVIGFDKAIELLVKLNKVN